MPNLFFITIMIAACFPLPATNHYNISPVFSFHNACRQTQLLNDTTFSLTGKISGQKKGTIKLIYTDKNGKYILDSSVVKKGRFYFSGNIAEPTMFFLEGTVNTSDMNDPNFTSFFLEPLTQKSLSYLMILRMLLSPDQKLRMIR